MGKREKPQQTEQELMKVLPKDHWNRINFQLIYLGRRSVQRVMPNVHNVRFRNGARKICDKIDELVKWVNDQRKK